jgi:large subunit ribosomal protein L18
MKKKSKKIFLQQKKRYLKKIIGIPNKPRLAVFRSNKHIYAQLIDDTIGHTLAFSSTLEKTFVDQKISSSTKNGALWVGENLGEKGIRQKMNSIVFDRGNKPYHGRIKNVAEGARKQGLIF